MARSNIEITLNKNEHELILNEAAQKIADRKSVVKEAFERAVNKLPSPDFFDKEMIQIPIVLYDKVCPFIRVNQNPACVLTHILKFTFRRHLLSNRLNYCWEYLSYE